MASLIVGLKFSAAHSEDILKSLVISTVITQYEAESDLNRQCKMYIMC